ncbi:GPI transamidase component [Coemansia thaxteri]|uniref:GPI transamidase component n=1 Tax=Coemansia thaxteri TaxID=2663907 RepID=A0A9W8BGV4_9FUNG|nr:GPI transamidase component [Coemansia thaxteri]
MAALADRVRALLKRRNEPRTVISAHGERRVVVSSIILLLLVGLPLWWATTRVHRASLPAEAIAAFGKAATQEMEMPFSFYVDATPALSATQASAIERQAQRLMDAQRMTGSARRVRYTARVVAGVGAPDVAGHYTLRLRNAEALGVEVGVDRTVAVAVSAEPRRRVADVARVVADMVGTEERAVRLGSSGNTAQRAVKYASEYAVSLTLLNENPVGGAAVTWDIESAAAAFMQPLVNALRPLTRLHVSTQVLHHAGPPPVAPLVASQSNASRTDKFSYLTRDMLPHFVNSPWWNLASTDPIAPTLSFILYVPALAHQPLRISATDGVAGESKIGAFVIAQWGGVAIANLPSGTKPGAEVVIRHAELQKYFGVFIAQLRELIGIRRDTPLLPAPGVIVRQATATGISAWELDALTRQWLLANRHTAITTLQSLVRLVDSMQNMVVMDEIKNQVDQSLAALSAIPGALASNHLLAFELAANASSFAEGAFFDPSMVSMLYFPDQHKYAIYLPFFLPVTIPLLAAIKKLAAAAKKKPAAARSQVSGDKKDQ